MSPRPDHRSPAADLYRRLYRTVRWREIRADQLARHPLCQRCEKRGIRVRATICHHVDRHRGDEEKFWRGPFLSLCKTCHDGPIQRQEATGFVIGSDGAGRPVDPNHPWNKAKAR